jgi:hypothetical protein
MATRNRTIIRQEQAFAAGDAAITDNLPVNPLSFVDVTIRGAAAAALTLPTYAQMLGVLSRIEVLFKGSSIISVSPADLFFLQSVNRWLRGVAQPHADTGADRWAITLRVSFSRMPYWIKEGFPASRAGELQIRYTPAAAFVGVQTPSLNVETEEILDGTFANYLKYTTISRTPPATGESDVDLPIGNDISGVLLFGTTVPTGTAVTASMREVRLLIDNQEALVPRTRWDTLHQQALEFSTPGQWLLEHVHRLAAGAPAGDALVEAAQQTGVHIFANYGWLTFDPLLDDAYLFHTNGRSQVKLRINADVADAQRIVPVELIKVGGAAAAA